MPPRPLAIISGSGHVSAAVARRFAKSYNVALVDRRPSIHKIAEEINLEGGRACSCNLKDFKADSLKPAFELVDSMFPGSPLAAAIFNRQFEGYINKPFLEMKSSEFMRGTIRQVKAGFHFSQEVLPLLCASKDLGLEHPPTLIFTGHPYGQSWWSSALGFSAGKAGLRSLAQCLASEFGPQGIHVAHTIVKGPLTDPTAEATDTSGDESHDAVPVGDAIAQTYWQLHTQPTSAMSFEVDLQPYERWGD